LDWFLQIDVSEVEQEGRLFTVDRGFKFLELKRKIPKALVWTDSDITNAFKKGKIMDNLYRKDSGGYGDQCGG
jgi:hypothetical protein